MFSIKYISYKNAHDRTIFIFCYVIIFWKIAQAEIYLSKDGGSAFNEAHNFALIVYPVYYRDW